MRRRLLRWLCWLTLGLVLASAAVGWLVGTTAGARVLLPLLARAGGVTLQTGTVTGRLLGPLELADVRARWPGGQVEIERLRLEWRPADLLHGRLQLERLTLAGTSLRLDETPARSTPPPVLAWPEPAGWWSAWDAELAELRLDGGEIRRGNASILQLGQFTAAASWHNGTLTIRRLGWTSPLGRLTATATAGLRTPALQAHLAIEPARDTGLPHSLQLQLNLAGGDRKTLLTGPVQFDSSATSPHWPALHLAGRLGLHPAGAGLTAFTLTSPDRRGTIEGSAAADWSGKGPPLRLTAAFSRLDLQPELGWVTELTGRLQLAGAPSRYAGKLELSNPGPAVRQLTLIAPFAGTATAISVSELSGDWLGGRLTGSLNGRWERGLTADGTLQVTGVDPGRAAKAWPGSLNGTFHGELQLSNDQPLTAAVQLQLQQSRLRGQPVTGELQARLHGADLQLERADFRGPGFGLQASGRLQQRLGFQAHVDRLQDWHAGLHGSLHGQGWLRWRERQLAGQVEVQGNELAQGDLHAAGLRLTAAVDDLSSRLRLDAQLTQVSRGPLQFDRLSLTGQGTIENHRWQLRAERHGGEIRAVAAGGWQNRSWQGRLLQCEGREENLGRWRLADAVPIQWNRNGIRLEPAVWRGDSGGRIRLASDLRFAPLRGKTQLQWQSIHLRHANPWLDQVQLDGLSSGRLDLSLLADRRLDLHGRFEAATDIRLPAQGLNLALQRVEIRVDGDAAGLTANLALQLRDGGAASARFHSASPARQALPTTGELRAEWHELPIALLAPLLPKGVKATGKGSGEMNGRLLSGRQLELTGSAHIDAGRLTWETRQGRVSAQLRTARVTGRWRDQSLSGELHLALADYGTVEGQFQLPLAARWPVRPEPAGALRLSLDAQLAETGLLPALFPGMIQDSAGELTLHLQGTGSWERPRLSGELALRQARARLPVAGIELQSVALRSRFEGDRLTIDHFQATSGPGQLQGSGEVRFRGWQPVGYRMKLQGKDFQAVHLPELDLQVSPELVLSGTAKRLKVRGTIDIPHLWLQQAKTEPPVQVSPDVILLGQPPQARQPLPVGLDLNVLVRLGDSVLVRMKGVDARLQGEVRLLADDWQNIRARGRIEVADGSYASHGVRLHIRRGTLLFAGGPVKQPTLDVLAVRQVGEVTAGVQISGVAPNPKIQLYADPPMPDTDILAYMVLGHPLGANQGQASALMLAASGLLGQGESTLLQERIKSRLGLDVLTVDAGNGDVQQSMVTIGKYLGPDLFISLGQSVFSNSREFHLRYTLSRHWELESQLGTVSGVDLFYKIEFR